MCFCGIVTPESAPALFTGSTMGRKELLFSMFDAKGLGLEIGPGFNPLVPKRDGYTVETLDHQTARELREKYQNAGVDLGQIEEVDHVSSGGSILQLVGKPKHFDYIVASHVIEHTTDLLGFVKDCQQLLKDSGVLVLAVPDKRFSFDCLRPCATTGQVLQAHLDQRSRHTPGQVFDEIAYNCTREGAIAWPPEASGPLALFRQLEDAKAFFEHYLQSGSYVDIHGWQFTPSSFRLILNDLAQIGATTLREQAFHDGQGSEFFTALCTQAAGCPVDRLQLAQQAIQEQQAMRMLADTPAMPQTPSGNSGAQRPGAYAKWVTPTAAMTSAPTEWPPAGRPGTCSVARSRSHTSRQPAESETGTGHRRSWRNAGAKGCPAALLANGCHSSAGTAPKAPSTATPPACCKRHKSLAPAKKSMPGPTRPARIPTRVHGGYRTSGAPLDLS
jgi:SAM-dependent methyltransferase